MKKFSAAVFIIGIVLFLSGFILPYVLIAKSGNQGAVGIIGGADGPTAKFITASVFKNLFLVLKYLGGALILTGIFALLFENTVKNNSTVKTALLSFGLSGLTAAGLGCLFNVLFIVFFSHPDKHPYEYPLSIAVGLICLAVFTVILCLYIKERMKIRKFKGIIIDICLFSVWLTPLLLLIDYLHNSVC